MFLRMAHYWLIITFSCFGSATLQHVWPASDYAFNQLDYVQVDSRHPPTPFTTHFQHQISQENPQGHYQQNVFPGYKLSQELELPLEKERYRRGAQNAENLWMPNLVDTDKTFYYQKDMKPISDPPPPPAVQMTDRLTTLEDVMGTERPDLKDMPISKRNFSPWGGKRSRRDEDSDAMLEQMWSWKRGVISKEPMMPKRARFSPWGGKRSGHVILRPPGKKASTLIYSTSMPELTRVVTNYLPGDEKYNFAGFQFVPSVDKRHPLKILAVSSKLDKPDAMGFTQFAVIPKLFKFGHPYVAYNMKKDGKRKVKFSAWGGKRSPPIIGPIWTRGPIDFPESLLNAILVVKNPSASINTVETNEYNIV